MGRRRHWTKFSPARQTHIITVIYPLPMCRTACTSNSFMIFQVMDLTAQTCSPTIPISLTTEYCPASVAKNSVRLKNSTKTLLVLEASALEPYSWHQPKLPVPGGWPMFNDARNMVSFVDGHASYINIYWNNTINYPNGGISVAAYYDPPAGYDYQWSGN